jgi:hypothetical protein
MSTGEPLFIIHRIPGRVRLAGASLRVDPARAERIAALVSGIAAVRSARINPVAASLVIDYEVGVPLAELLRSLGQRIELLAYGFGRIERERPARPPGPLPTPARTAQAVLKTAAWANSASRSIIPPQIDLKIVVPGLIFGVGIYRFITGRHGAAPHWLVFLMYGFDAFSVLNKGVMRKFLESPGSTPVAAGGGAPS